MPDVEHLPVRDRILLHLGNYSSQENKHRVPREVSQRGIAEAVAIELKHVAQYVRPMIRAGLVIEKSSYIEGGKQHQKVYFLSERGRVEAGWIAREVPITRVSNQSGKNSRRELAIQTATG